MKKTILKLEPKVDESARSSADRDRKVMEAIRAVQTTAQQNNGRAWWRKLLGK